jgi:hypothetical protein
MPDLKTASGLASWGRFFFDRLQRLEILLRQLQAGCCLASSSGCTRCSRRGARRCGYAIYRSCALSFAAWSFEALEHWRALENQDARMITVSPHGVIYRTVVLRYPGAETGRFRKLPLPVPGQGCVVAITRCDRDIEIAVYPSAPSRPTSERSHFLDAKIGVCPSAHLCHLKLANSVPSPHRGAHDLRRGNALHIPSSTFPASLQVSASN